MANHLEQRKTGSKRSRYDPSDLEGWRSARHKPNNRDADQDNLTLLYSVKTNEDSQFTKCKDIYIALWEELAAEGGPDSREWYSPDEEKLLSEMVRSLEKEILEAPPSPSDNSFPDQNSSMCSNDSSSGQPLNGENSDVTADQSLSSYSLESSMVHIQPALQKWHYILDQEKQ
eukprot:c53280_g1_i1 orf=279-797(-)